MIDIGNTTVPEQLTAEDALTMALDGGVETPEELLGVGEHRDDDPSYAVRRRLRRMAKVTQRYGNTTLPRECMFIHVCERNLRRPVHNVTRNNNF